MSERQNKETVGQAFVPFIIDRMKDKGIAAALRRADNPATEYQSWETLAAFKIDLDNPYKRLPFTTVAAAMAKAKIEHNGTLGIGQAIARCYENGNDNDQAKAKLRRLLACDSVIEACRILRALLSLIESKSNGTLDFARLLDELLWFQGNSQTVKSRWAQNFFAQRAKETDGTGA